MGGGDSSPQMAEHEAQDRRWRWSLALGVLVLLLI